MWFLILLLVFALIVAYRHGQRSTHSSATTQPIPPIHMDEATARHVLGLGDQANTEEVIRAHRRVIRLVHPDRGGTTYLASLVNHARDILSAPRPASHD
jgi:hypothetical protein